MEKYSTLKHSSKEEYPFIQPDPEVIVVRNYDRPHKNGVRNWILTLCVVGLLFFGGVVLWTCILHKGDTEMAPTSPLEEPSPQAHYVWDNPDLANGPQLNNYGGVQGPIYEVNIFDNLSGDTGANGNDYWQYCSFKVDRPISVVSLGIAGPPTNAIYTIKMAILQAGEDGGSAIDNVAERLDSSVITQTQVYVEGGRKTYFVPFDAPIQLEANKWYGAFVYMTGGPGSTYYGIPGRTSKSVDCGDGCSVNLQFGFHDGQPYTIGFQV